jgi:hypothetical protein
MLTLMGVTRILAKGVQYGAPSYVHVWTLSASEASPKQIDGV